MKFCISINMLKGMDDPSVYNRESIIFYKHTHKGRNCFFGLLTEVIFAYRVSSVALVERESEKVFSEPLAKKEVIDVFSETLAKKEVFDDLETLHRCKCCLM